MSRLPAWIDQYLPPRGPCAMCGGDDARHRTTDAIVACVKAGDPPTSVAADYHVPLEFVLRLVAEAGK